MAKKLTPKQAKFVKGIAEGKTQRDAYIEAYDTKGNIPTVDNEASKTMSKPQVQDALRELFGLEETKQVVQNLQRLAISAEDEKIQVDATKVYLDKALPKDSGTNVNINFNQVADKQRDVYDL